MTLSPNNNQNPISKIFQGFIKISHLLIKPWLKLSEIDLLKKYFESLDYKVESITEKDISSVKEEIQRIREEFKTSKEHSDKEINFLKRELNCQLKEDVYKIKEDIYKIKESIRETIYGVINDLDRQIQFSNEAERKEIENRKERLRGALTEIDQAINALPKLEQSRMHDEQAAQWLTNNKENLVGITIKKLSKYSPELKKHDDVKLFQQELQQYLEFLCIFLQKGKKVTNIPEDINAKYLHFEALSLMKGEISESQEISKNINRQVLAKVKFYFDDLINVLQKKVQ